MVAAEVVAEAEEVAEAVVVTGSEAVAVEAVEVAVMGAEATVIAMEAMVEAEAVVEEAAVEVETDLVADMSPTAGVTDPLPGEEAVAAAMAGRTPTTRETLTPGILPLREIPTPATHHQSVIPTATESVIPMPLLPLVIPMLDPQQITMVVATPTEEAQKSVTPTTDGPRQLLTDPPTRMEVTSKRPLPRPPVGATLLAQGATEPRTVAALPREATTEQVTQDMMPLDRCI